MILGGYMKRSLLLSLSLISFVVIFLFNEGQENINRHVSVDTQKSDKYPASQYFKNWYAPYDVWPVEMQTAAIEQIKKLPGDEAITFYDKSGRLRTSSISPWVQKGPYGIEHLQDNPPNPSFYSYYSGRIISLADDGSGGFYIGSANGGLWKKISTIVYEPISDDVQSLAIGGVAVDPTDINRIFIGTGEFKVNYGTGVYRSTDGGGEWELLPLSPSPSIVTKILISTAPKYIFVSSYMGVYRSTDDGDTWTRLFDKNVCDMSISPGGFMLAGVYKDGIYKSIDWGVNWFKLTTDLPSTEIGRISVACAPNNTSKAYVQIGNRATDSVRGVYKTTNSGSNWIDVTPTPSELSGGKNNYLGQQWYNNVITVNPENSDIIWAGGVFLMRSADGGDTWQNIGATGALPRRVHPDIHVLMYVGSTLYVGCDGGVFYTNDEGTSWNSSINEFLPITQFYNIGVEFIGGRIKFGGAQDNGISGTTTSSPDYWTLKIGGDGIDAAVDPVWSNNIYVTHNGPNKNWRRRSTDGGYSWTSINSPMTETGATGQDFWHTYIVTHPMGTNWIFTNAGSYVYWSSNKGDTWLRMGGYESMDITGRPSVNYDASFVYLPVNDLFQVLAGFTYVPASNSWTMGYISNGLPSKSVKRICPAATEPTRAYALFYGIGDNDKIYKTTNKGQLWTNITNDLPDLPVNDLLEIHSQKLIVGTDKGAFITTNGGSNWVRWNAGMPLGTQIMDLEITYRDDQYYVVAGTYGRSTFERLNTGMDGYFSLNSFKQKLYNLSPGATVNDCTMVYNKGEAELDISAVWSKNTSLIITPTSGRIPPGDSLKFNFSVYVPSVGGPFGGGSRNFSAEIVFVHNAAGSPSVLQLEGYIGDEASYRTFEPESLIVKKEIKRNPISTSWCFNFDNNNRQRNPASALYVEFNSPILELTSYTPFDSAENVDGKGKKWKFSNGSVDPDKSAFICGKTKGKKSQRIKRWWWIADLVVWEGDVERSVEGILGEINGKKLPYRQVYDLGMPNTANLRRDVFSSYPFDKTRPLIIGVADPDSKLKKVAYVSFAKHSDLLNSLKPGRSGKMHDGPPRSFEFYDNGKEMIGVIKKLTPDKQSNRLFAELVALKLNIAAGRIGITPITYLDDAPISEGINSLGKTLGIEPVPWDELKYVDPGNLLDGYRIWQIDSLADRYMTYGDSSVFGNAIVLDSVIRRINRAFVGPLDTISFANELKFTAVRPIAEVPFLERAPSLRSTANLGQRIESILPDEYELYQNYPNPFNPVTTIEFYIPDQSVVTLNIYDMLGREVVTLIDRELLDEGTSEIEFDASNFATGVYFYSIKAEGIYEEGESGRTYQKVMKMLLMK